MISAPARTDNQDLDQLFFRLHHQHDLEARDELVRRLQPLARAIARRYVSPREPFEDLLQVANLGLLKAVERFDPTRGTSFRAFGVPTILGELKRYFRDCGWSVHVTRGAQDLALKVERAQRELEREHGRVPRLTAVAEYLELGIEEVAEGLQTASFHHAASLDAPSDPNDEGSALHDHVGQTDEGFALSDTRLTIASLTAQLPPLEREVLVLRFAGEMTQAQIGQRVGVSQMQVSRILRRTLEHLYQLSAREEDL